MWTLPDGLSLRFQVHHPQLDMVIQQYWLVQELSFSEEKDQKVQFIEIYTLSTQSQWHGIRVQREVVHHQQDLTTLLTLWVELRCLSSEDGMEMISSMMCMYLISKSWPGLSLIVPALLPLQEKVNALSWLEQISLCMEVSISVMRRWKQTDMERWVHHYRSATWMISEFLIQSHLFGHV